MKPILASLFLSFVAASPAWAASDDEVKALFATYDAAWAKGDTKTLLSLLTDDAVVRNPAGIGGSGKAEIGKMMAGLTLGPGKAAPKTTVTSVRWPSPEVAVVDADIDGAIGPDGQKKTSKRISIVVKKGGKWLLSDSRGYFLVPPLGSAPAAK